jgi:hypothetical protein
MIYRWPRLPKWAGCSEGTVKSRMHYAKKAMKEILSGGGMERGNSELREGLLARLPQPENLSGHREEVAVLLAKH